MADAEFYIAGIIECQSNLQRYSKVIIEKLAEALFQEALNLLEAAKARVPVLTGSLRDSGRVQRPVITESGVSVTISFGDEVVTWAIPVHERMSVRHISGRSKYLESVILENASSLLQRIASRVAESNII